MPAPPDAAALHATIRAVWRAEAARIVGAVARITHDLDAAEDLAQDALEAALRHWPAEGLPARPGAWLVTTAKRRALDGLRHRQMAEGHHAALAQDLAAREAELAPDVADVVDARRQDAVGDDLLRLMFVACHPVLPREQQLALTLKLLGGLETPEIARAFLVPEATVAQRIVRAKRRLAESGVAFELPQGDALAQRLGAVMGVVYLLFNAGYTATRGSDWMRPALCDEALRLARMLAALAPDEPEAAGLAALLEIQASRSAARLDAAGDPVLLEQQDRQRWDRLLIRRGLDALARGQALCAQQGRSPGPYLLQAAIAACHARAARAEATDWAAISALYARLMAVAPSPVVQLNQAVAVGRHQGPAAGLALADALLGHPALAGYPYLAAVRADLLARLGRLDEARAAYAEAAALNGNAREAALMRARAEALAAGGAGSPAGLPRSPDPPQKL